MYPISKWLEGHGWSKSLAITACLLIVTILFTALFALLVWQLSVFSNNIEEWKPINLLLSRK